ncbi:hypothetical protein GCM10009657_29030 [Oryzihumus leptocrescens]
MLSLTNVAQLGAVDEAIGWAPLSLGWTLNPDGMSLRTSRAAVSSLAVRGCVTGAVADADVVAADVGEAVVEDFGVIDFAAVAE